MTQTGRSISNQGLVFIGTHEGFVSRAYRDPAGVLTIGYGFTMGSRIFAGWWRGLHGRGLGVGDSITRAQANMLLGRIAGEEVVPAVAARLPALSQTQLDACASVVYNLGPRALGWRWGQALAAGRLAEAARLLRKTGITAGGRRLPGLVRRRADEARLLETGDYGTGEGANTPARPTVRPDPELRQVQRALAGLGYRPGPLDGRPGPQTEQALRHFQRDHPPLVVDGIAGPDTRAALRREQSRRGCESAGIGTAAVAATLAHALEADLRWALALAVLAGLLVLAGGVALRHRGRLVPWLARQGARWR